MTIRPVSSFVAGTWLPPGPGARPIESAITGQVIAEAGNDALDTGAMLEVARGQGGPALRAMTFHDRARMLKALAQHLNAQKEVLYGLSFDTGATRTDTMIDVDGGIGTLMVYAAKGRRELPDARVYRDGGLEGLSRDGDFLGQHVCTPLQGVAIHINAFNFPVWGMLEKLAPTLLAGVPAIVKPATATCYVTEACVRLMIDSAILPPGSLQFVAGGLGDTLDRLTLQDIVGFTGSAETALALRSRPSILRQSIRFLAEQDSLNASILGPDAGPGTPEFELFLKEVSREITTKAGQKCTAVRRVLVPEPNVDAVIAGLSARLERTTVGDPRDESTRMGALVSRAQRSDVLDKAAILGREARLAWGDPHRFADSAGAFCAPLLFHCEAPDSAERVHDTEAFGPVSTVMGYRDLDHAIALANRGGGSLVASVFTHAPDVARQVVLGAGAYHGRVYFSNRDTARGATGHGAPMPHMTHGGPGRAGGGEELGGIRGVMHYMQRTAVQGSAALLGAVGETWVPGGPQTTGPGHPFVDPFGSLEIGRTLTTAPRQVTLEDVEHFASFTGDTFYAHMDEEAAARNPFFPGRVAHGYLLLSFAAGLFVEPAEGPVLANTGLDSLRFLKPVVPGDSIRVALTVMAKTPRTPEYGEVRWHVRLTNQDDEAVAEYELLTMVAQ